MKCEMFQYFRASDPSFSRVHACRWHFASRQSHSKTVHKLVASGINSSIQMFETAEQPALLALSFSADTKPATTLQAVPPTPESAETEWTADADILVRWSARRSEKPNRLVVVCQPLARPDPNPQRDRIAVVLRARNGDESPPAGLSTANFFANRDGPFVLNLAEWTSATAHRDALAQASYGQHRLVVALARDARSSSGYRSRRNSPLSAARDRAGRRDSLNKTWSMR